MTQTASITVISGGQTGVDRAALDAALRHGIACAGWCPDGYLAEDGRLSTHYPLQALPGGDNDARTRKNVEDSDATVILHAGEISGGTLLSSQHAEQAGRPLLALDLSSLSGEQAGRRLAAFIAGRQTINFSGPRASEWEGGYIAVRRVLDPLFRTLAQQTPSG